MTVRLVVSVDQSDPIAGWLERDNRVVPFTGWLDFVRAVSDAIGEADSPSGDNGRHLHPIGDAQLGEDV